MKRADRRQQGSAVILALLIAAAAAAAASLALARQDASVRRLEAGRDHAQALWMLRSGAHWARAVLAEDARVDAVDHAGELWAGGLAPTDVEGGTIAGEIRDAQGLFNLANLVAKGEPSEPDVAALARLLAALRLPPALAPAIAAAQPMRDASELARVRGCDEATVARLLEVVTLLPRRTALNVNTARPEALVAAVEGLTLAEALVLARDLKASPVRSLAELQSRFRFSPGISLGVKSDFFIVEGQARVGVAEARLEALYERKGSALPALVRQKTS
jgi:general secretion pathway protein K